MIFTNFNLPKNKVFIKITYNSLIINQYDKRIKTKQKLIYSIMGAKFKYSNPAIYIGSFILLTCLICSTITYICCYTSIAMPKKAKHCIVNTWVAMALLSFLYTFGIQQTEEVEICEIVGIGLHYLSLCSLFWMAVSAK